MDGLSTGKTGISAHIIALVLTHVELGSWGQSSQKKLARHIQALYPDVACSFGDGRAGEERYTMILINC